MEDRGFSLVEVLVALGILCVAVLGGLQLITTAVQAMSVARTQHLTATLASSRLEQLRNLQFEYDQDGSRVTDLSTNLASETITSDGGGLAASAPGSLHANVRGFVDYLDAAGRWVGDGEVVPGSAVYVRRWAVEPSGLAADAVTLQVRVAPLAAERAGGAGHARGESRLVTVLARTQR